MRGAPATPPLTTLSVPPDGVRAPCSSSNSTSSLESVHVSAAFGRVVGRSPPRPPQAGIRPGLRSTPSISRLRDPAVTSPEKLSSPTRRRADTADGTSSADLPPTGSLTSRPPTSSTPTGLPSTPKKPPFTPASAFVRRAIALTRSAPAARELESTEPSLPVSLARSTVSTLIRSGPALRTMRVQVTPGAGRLTLRRSAPAAGAAAASSRPAVSPSAASLNP